VPGLSTSLLETFKKISFLLDKLLYHTFIFLLLMHRFVRVPEVGQARRVTPARKSGFRRPSRRWRQTLIERFTCLRELGSSRISVEVRARRAELGGRRSSCPEEGLCASQP